MITDINNLKTHLTEGQVRVDFTKVDGSHRSMLCTKNFTSIPPTQVPKNTKKKQNDSVLAVFDLEKQAWRSIRIENIQSWHPEEILNGPL